MMDMTTEGAPTTTFYLFVTLFNSNFLNDCMLINTHESKEILMYFPTKKT